MSNSLGVAARNRRQDERRRSGIAAVLTLLLHLLVLLLALWSRTPTMTPPQGASSGSWVEVDFIGETREPDPVPPVPPSGDRATHERSDRPAPPQAPPATARIQSTLVPDAEDPLPPELDDITRNTEAPTPPTPSHSGGQAAQRRPLPASANPQATTRRRPEAWGQPPGMVVQELAPAEPGPTLGSARNQGNANDASLAEPSLELGGYHVYYDLRSERRLRAWRDEGITELFIPLPGTRQLMVCPLEVALRRDSGKCRPVAPNDPGLETIGDAREVISVLQVHKQGKLLWRGPGPYR